MLAPPGREAEKIEAIETRRQPRPPRRPPAPQPAARIVKRLVDGRAGQRRLRGRQPVPGAGIGGQRRRTPLVVGGIVHERSRCFLRGFPRRLNRGRARRARGAALAAIARRGNDGTRERWVGLLTPGPTLSPSQARPTHVTWGKRNAMAAMTTVVLPGHSGGAGPESHRSSLLSPPSPAAAVGHHHLAGECRDGADPVNEPGDGLTTRNACQPGARPREAVPKGPGCASHCAGWRASDRKVCPFETACKVSPTVTTSP